MLHEGRPLAGARVECRREPRPPELDLLGWEWVPKWSGSNVLTDEDGGFDLTIVDSARYELRATKVPEGVGLLGPLQLDASSGADVLEITIERALGSIEGRVTLPNGHALDEILLTLPDHQTERGELPIGSDGSFRATDLVPGPCTIHVEPRDDRDLPGTARYHVPPLYFLDWLPFDPAFTVEIRPAVP